MSARRKLEIVFQDRKRGDTIHRKGVITLNIEIFKQVKTSNVHLKFDKVLFTNAGLHGITFCFRKFEFDFEVPLTFWWLI